MRTPFAAALAFCIAPLTTATAEEVVNVYCWSAYLPDLLQQSFTAETGIRVVYDMFDSNEMLETKLLAGASGYDVVCPNAVPHLRRMLDADLFAPLDRSKLPNWRNLDPAILTQLDAAADPGNRFAAPWMWGSYAVGWIPEKIDAIMSDAPTDSLRMVLDPEIVSRFSDCGVAFVDSANDLIALTLIYLGLDPASQDPADLAKVSAHLAKVRPHVSIIHGSQYYTAMADGDVCLAVGYSGDFGIAAARAAETGQDFTVALSIPKEGSILFIDSWTIPSDAPNADNAHALIDYTLRPETAAAATNALFYANANAAALPLVDPALRDDPSMFPPEDIKARLRLSVPVDLATRRRLLRVWDDFKSGR